VVTIGKVFSLKGRMRRRTFGMVILVGVLLRVVPVLSFNLLHYNGVQLSDTFDYVFGAFWLVFFFFVPVIIILASVKRLRDIEKPLWLVLLLFVPIINLGFLGYLLNVEGVRGANQYGADPKAVIAA
jgi:uncharacterized membrane protein YhaH (DUF805 family)